MGRLSDVTVVVVPLYVEPLIGRGLDFSVDLRAGGRDLVGGREAVGSQDVGVESVMVPPAATAERRQLSGSFCGSTVTCTRCSAWPL